MRSYSDRVREGKVDDHRISHREPASAINVSPASVLSLIDFPRNSRPNGDRHRYVCARVRRCISILCNTGDPWIREIERTARQRKSGVFPLVKGRHIWTRQVISMYTYMNLPVDISSTNLLLGTLQFACVKTRRRVKVNWYVRYLQGWPPTVCNTSIYRPYRRSLWKPLLANLTFVLGIVRATIMCWELLMDGESALELFKYAIYFKILE